MVSSILAFIGGAIFWVIPVVILIFAPLYIKSRYKIPKADEALVLTGGKQGLRVLPGRGAFVSPFQKHEFFSLATLMVESDVQETQSSTLVPIVVKWTAQLRTGLTADGSDETLLKAVQGFSGYNTSEIIASLKQTLDGEVRAVVATMPPEGVIRDKESFTAQVINNVRPRTEELGFELISLNISEVTDNNQYFLNASAEDREERRKNAERLTAEANKEVAVTQAEADEEAKQAQQKRDLAIAEQQRELSLRQSAIKIEADTKQADADIALELQNSLRQKELATAQRNVVLTNAETEKQRTAIEAEAQQRKDEIAAESAARVDEVAARAAANVARQNAAAEAEAFKLTAEAEAETVRTIGTAEAEAIKAKGEAEAASTLAKGKAEAEVQRLTAEALAANDGANLQVTLAEINRDTTVKVYTTVGEAMAQIGENATFVDMGGKSADGSDLLTSVMGNIPEMLKKLDVKSEALHGTSFKKLASDVVDQLGQDSSQ